MATSSGIGEHIAKAKRWHQQGLAQLRALHDEGAPGRRVVNGMSDLVDNIIRLLYSQVLKEMGPAGDEINSRVALVFHGGCGRREFAPYSDIDFMAIYRGQMDATIEEFARKLTQSIFDTGFQLGFSIRTPRQACSMALEDPAIFSSLTESRIIGGSTDLYANYMSRFRRIVGRRATHIIRAIVAARDAESQRFGETVYLLRPNVKKTRGGLRDVHLVRWLGFVRFGETDIDQLCRKGAIPQIDALRLQKANEFLLRLRNELHFHAGRASDMLGKNEQVRIAEKWGYEGDEVALPVEKLMRDYFTFTSEIRYCSDHFVELSQQRRTFTNVFEPLMTRPIDDVFCMSPFQIGIQPEKIEGLKTDLTTVLKLMRLSIIHSREIDYETWEAIRTAMIESREIGFTAETGGHFMALLRSPEKLGFMLRKLAELRALERIIPAFGHARNLMQFNEYHQFTVDEHSILAVECATEFADDRGPLGNAYRSLRDKSVLHLALLIHDLGKGFTEDHCEVGRRLAVEICPRLQVAEDDAETIKFLVHNHLMMSHVAFQRDINDPNMVAEFSANVGSPKNLRLLYLLTCADISAVGPDTLTQWKFDLLTELFTRSMAFMKGLHETRGEGLVPPDQICILREMAPDEKTANWLLEQVQLLPAGYSKRFSLQQIAKHLLELAEETAGYQPVAHLSFDDETMMFELCIGRRVKRRSGIYYRIAGMLASEGLVIRTADIKHLDDPFVWYWFQFENPNLNEPPSAAMLSRILDKAKHLAESKEDKPPVFPIHYKDDPRFSKNLPKPPVNVVIDSHSVEWATVIDVYAWSRVGLLYSISKLIYELKLDVRFARIAEYGMQVIAVFYVTDGQGEKILDARRLVEVRRKLLNDTSLYLESTP
ncbi:MAG: HD domain-containing protein [Planctomycetaceae bacterium]|nr:HD domain-containing protein [Planctomycetaceae bacterium]MCP4462538.1 HD domain-containing protein [Planctomycetaceae bacterium]MDG1806620.1 HD domain-containing protein [Pirellulaceae bacterium]